MIWMITSKAEMEDGENHVFCFNQEALGKDNIKLAVVEDTDELTFVRKEDIIITRTANKNLLKTIESCKVSNTSESSHLYSLVKDKVRLSDYLRKHDILVPQKFSWDDVPNGKALFVKPRYGNDSFGITEKSICYSKEDVLMHAKYIKEELNQDVIIEDFIDGMECTVAYINKGGESTFPIEIDCSSMGGIQTHAGKVSFDVCCSPEKGNEIKRAANHVASILGIKHYARIDFRKNRDGRYYLIDINLLPGIGPTNYFPRCMLLCANISYIDAMKAIVKTASL